MRCSDASRRSSSADAVLRHQSYEHLQEMSEDPEFGLRSLTEALAPDDVLIRGFTIETSTARSKTQMNKLIVKQLAWQCRLTFTGREIFLSRVPRMQAQAPQHPPPARK